MFGIQSSLQKALDKLSALGQELGKPANSEKIRNDLTQFGKEKNLPELAKALIADSPFVAEDAVEESMGTTVSGKSTLEGETRYKSFKEKFFPALQLLESEGEVRTLYDEIITELKRQGSPIWDSSEKGEHIGDYQFFLPCRKLLLDEAVPWHKEQVRKREAVEAVASLQKLGFKNPKDCRPIHVAYALLIPEVYRRDIEDEEACITALAEKLRRDCPNLQETLKSLTEAQVLALDSFIVDEVCNQAGKTPAAEKNYQTINAETTAKLDASYLARKQ